LYCVVKTKENKKKAEDLQEQKRPQKINEPKKSLYAYLSISTAAGCFRQTGYASGYVSLYKYN
jgi:hypothetical protein